MKETLTWNSSPCTLLGNRSFSMGCAENTCCIVIGVPCCALRALSSWSETHLSLAVPCRLLLCSVSFAQILSRVELPRVALSGECNVTVTLLQ